MADRVTSISRRYHGSCSSIVSISLPGRLRGSIGPPIDLPPFGHQLDRPARRCAAVPFSATGAQIYRRRRRSTPLTSKPPNQCGEHWIAMSAHQKADRDHRRATAAVNFQLAFRPVTEMVGCSERWRMHQGNISHEHIRNKDLLSLDCVSEAHEREGK
jgi:hypothetical protein